MLTDEIKGAIIRLLRDEMKGIEQVDAVITEDAMGILLYAYTADPEVTYVAGLPMPDWRKV